MDSILGPKWNGRVNIKSPDNKAQFTIRNPNLTSSTLHDPLYGLVDESNLSRAYFSRENTQIIQNALRKAIYDQSKGQYLIGNQDVRELHIVMRSMYLQYARNLPTDIAEQIDALNKLVLNYCTQQVYNECQARMQYINDVSTLVVPIAPPINTADTDRELVLHEWF